MILGVFVLGGGGMGLGVDLLKNVWKSYSPFSTVFAFPVASLVDVHHTVGHGVVFLLEPQRRVGGVSLQSRGFVVIAGSRCLRRLCSNGLSLATLGSLLLFQTNLYKYSVCVCVCVCVCVWCML